jgi:hypothetical protein
MQEKVRQFIIFGNFNNITFDNLSKLDDIKAKYKLEGSAQPDITGVEQQLLNKPIIQETMILRPVLKSKDGIFSIVFGTSIIQFRENQVDNIELKKDYTAGFNAMVLEIIDAIYTNYKIVVKRVALNGSVYFYDIEIMQSLFKSVFNKKNPFSDSSDEWGFRINNQKYIDELTCDVNEITVCSRTKIFESTKIVDILVLSYDFNTKVNNNNNFDMGFIKVFNKIGLKFREKVVSR